MKRLVGGTIAGVVTLLGPIVTEQAVVLAPPAERAALAPASPGTPQPATPRPATPAPPTAGSPTTPTGRPTARTRKPATPTTKPTTPTTKPTAPTTRPTARPPATCTPPPRQDTATPSPAISRLPLPELHRLATGRGQLIAVIDTGVSPHPLLAGRLRGGGDLLAGGDGLQDCDGHGTAVAGLLAAAAPPPVNGRSTAGLGVAPAARLLAIRQASPSFTVPGPDGEQPAGDTDTLAEAIGLAVRAGAGIINISAAVCLPAERAATAGAVLPTALRRAAAADVVVVAAAGNIGPGSCADTGSGADGLVSLPGWYDGDLLTVGAVGPDDSAAPFTMPGPWVDVAAPGTGLRALTVDGGTTGVGVEGTSFAAALVAGLAALIRERYPQLSARQVIARITATARRPPGGRDDAVGHGVIDPTAALTAVPDVLAPAAIAPPGAAALTAAPDPPGSTPPWPVDALALALFLGAVAAAVGRLRPAHHRSTPSRRGAGPSRP